MCHVTAQKERQFRNKSNGIVKGARAKPLLTDSVMYKSGSRYSHIDTLLTNRRTVVCKQDDRPKLFAFDSTNKKLQTLCLESGQSRSDISMEGLRLSERLVAYRWHSSWHHRVQQVLRRPGRNWRFPNFQRENVWRSPAEGSLFGLVQGGVDRGGTKMFLKRLHRPSDQQSAKNPLSSVFTSWLQLKTS